MCLRRNGMKRLSHKLFAKALEGAPALDLLVRSHAKHVYCLALWRTASAHRAFILIKN